jgi:glutaredoxin
MRVVVAAVAIAIAIVAGAARPAAASPPSLEVFVKPGCSHCERAKVWLDDLRERRPDVAIVVHDVAADRAARERLEAMAEDAGLLAAVPAFVAGDRLFVGFDSATTTGAAIEAWLDRREDEIDTIGLPWLGDLRVGDVGLFAFTLAVGLVDGFNPCAMWVLLFLLALLVNLRSRRRMLLVAGTFVGVSGVAYYLFMAAWLGAFLVIGVSRWLQAALGLIALGVGAIHVKDALAPARGPSLAIPAAAKPRIYARIRSIVHAENLRAALVATIALAVMVNLVELLCTAGLPAVYAQILTAQGLPSWQHHAYLALYIVAYMFDDALMVTIAVITLRRHKLQERGGRVLQLVSGAVMLALGVVLLVKPEALSFR